MKIQSQLKGMNAIRAKLQRVKHAVGTRCLRAGVTKAMQIVAKSAKGKVKKGLLRKSIGLKVKVYRHSRKVVGMVGPRRGMGETRDGVYHDPVKYAHIVEFGRAAVVATESSVLSDGEQVFGVQVAAYAGNPFLRPANDETREQQKHAVASITMAKLELEIARSGGINT